MTISRRVQPEVSRTNAVRAIKEEPGRGVPDTGKPGVAGGWVTEGEECDPLGQEKEDERPDQLKLELWPATAEVAPNNRGRVSDPAEPV